VSFCPESALERDGRRILPRAKSQADVFADGRKLIADGCFVEIL
jgi:hypothetical protein